MIKHFYNLLSLVSFYPMVPYFSGNVPWRSVLLPRLIGKQLEHEILSRHQHMNLIAEVFLEGFAAPDQRGAALTADLLAARVVWEVAKMMENTETNSPAMLLSALANTATTIGRVFDRGVDIQVAHQQTRQAATVFLDRVHAIPLTLARSRSATDHDLPLSNSKFLARRVAPPCSVRYLASCLRVY